MGTEAENWENRSNWPRTTLANHTVQSCSASFSICVDGNLGDGNSKKAVYTWLKKKWFPSHCLFCHSVSPSFLPIFFSNQALQLWLSLLTRSSFTSALNQWLSISRLSFHKMSRKFSFHIFLIRPMYILNQSFFINVSLNLHINISSVFFNSFFLTQISRSHG